MTKDAQSALRRTMELYTKVTRFALLCNYVSRIIDPIKSRCAKFRYQPLSHSAMKQRLSTIAQHENIDVGEVTTGLSHSSPISTSTPPLDLLCELSQGDMRQAITLMQTASRLLGPSSSSSSSPLRLTSAHLLDVACVTPPAFIERLHAALKQNSFAALQSGVTEMVAQGFDSQSVLQGWLEVLMRDESIEEVKKASMCCHMAVVEKRLVDGSDELITMLDLFAYSSQLLHS